MLLWRYMSERMNGRDPIKRQKQTAHFNERPGILTIPSSDLLKRRHDIELRRELRGGAALKLGSTSTFGYLVRPTEEAAASVADVVDEAEQSITETYEVVVLPIEKYRDAIIDMVDNNRASIVVSETGGGKTTQVPQILMDAGYRVFMGEPRRSTVDGPGARIQEELDARLGPDVAEGLVEMIHGGRALRYENSSISLATAASLLRMLPEIMQRVAKGEKVAICIDEIHEDDQYVEALMGVVGYLASECPELRVVCMSATIDEEILKIPLGRITNREHPEEVNVPVMHVEGRPFTYTAHEKLHQNPVEVFLEFGQNSRVPGLVSRGYEEIKRMREGVIEGYELREPGSSARLIFKEFTGKASTRQREEIARLAKELPEDMQLVILGTPAMRSGITIPGMDWLVYDGMINREHRREDRGRGTVAEYASKAEIIQYFGRAGRDVPNAHVYLSGPMPSRKTEKDIAEFKKAYPPMSMAKRDDYAEPAIFNGNLAELLLLGVGSGVKPDDFNQFIINEQSHAALREAVTRLRSEFGAIDEDDTITEIGRLMSRFPVAPELARGLAEAMIQGRPKDHLARMAIIATAIDTGGFQMSRVSMEKANWRGLLRSGSTDDFIAQFDFWDAFRQQNLHGAASYDGFLFASQNDLDYTRFISTDESTEKTLRRLGVDPHRLDIDPPSYDEIAQIRRDFTAGMYGLTYREVPHKANADDKKFYFDPVVGAGEHPRRTLVTSSVLEPARKEVIAGMPTFRQKIRDGSVSEVELLGATLKVTHEDIGRYALAGGQVGYVEVPNTARIHGGMVQESRQGMFGSLRVNSHVSDKTLRQEGLLPVDEIPLESRKRLVDALQRNPGVELQELRSIAATLTEYRRLLTPEIIEQYRYQDAPADISLTYISNLLTNYAERTRSMQEVDLLIGKHMETNGLSVDLFYSTSAQQEMLRRSPEYISLGPDVQPLRILYSNGRPYATNVSAEQLAAIKGPLYIDEGFENPREVMHQVKKEGRGTRRISFGQQ